MSVKIKSYNTFLLWGLFSVMLLIGSCSAQEVDEISLKTIWYGSSYCAFVDLIQYESKYYCAFREAPTHFPISYEQNGKIRVLSSEDGIEWKTETLIEDKVSDLRDPKMYINKENELNIIYGNHVLGKTLSYKTGISTYKIEDQGLVLIEKDLINILDTSSKISYSDYWLWRVVQKDSIFYGIAYKDNNPIFVKSENGKEFTIVSYLNIKGNESAISFLRNTAYVFIRSNGLNGFLGSSEYPYKEWEWKELNYHLESPVSIQIGKSLYVCGRSGGGTTLFFFDIVNYRLEPLSRLSTEGDSGYPGMIYTNNELWIAYYSSSEGGNSRIHLMRMLSFNE